MARTTRTTPPDPTVADLREQLSAKEAQNDQMVEMLLELQEKVTALEAQHPTTAAGPAINKEQAALDAELAGLLEEFKDYSLIQTFERRVVAGTDAAVAIRLVGDPTPLEDEHGGTCRWKLRWFNLAKEGRAEQAKHEGYEQVRWDELQDRQMAIGDQTKPYVCRGDRGMEVLYKIPRKLFDYKKRRDAARLKGLLTSESAMRDHVANGVASLAAKDGGNGDQAGSTVHGKFLPPTITAGDTERVTL